MSWSSSASQTKIMLENGGLYRRIECALLYKFPDYKSAPEECVAGRIHLPKAPSDILNETTLKQMGASGYALPTNS